MEAEAPAKQEEEEAAAAADVPKTIFDERDFLERMNRPRAVNDLSNIHAYHSCKLLKNLCCCFFEYLF